MANKYWFKRKRYGYGWVPVTWQGFAALGIYLVLLLAIGLTLLDVQNDSKNRELGFFFTFVIVISFAMIRVCYRMGPKPKWRWGKKPDDDPNEDW